MLSHERGSEEELQRRLTQDVTLCGLATDVVNRPLPPNAAVISHALHHQMLETYNIYEGALEGKLGGCLIRPRGEFGGQITRLRCQRTVPQACLCGV